MKVLLVDDDPDLLDITTYALQREGFSILTATDGKQALRRWETEKPDVLVLDVNLPNVNGFEVCRQIRAHQGVQSATPILFLTALSGEEDVARGLGLGADDYITKPFSMRQLAMRLRVVHRRAQRSASTPGSPWNTSVPQGELRIGDLTIDIEAHEVQCGERSTYLTPIEFRLLYLLAMNAGHVVTHARLVEYAWQYERGNTSVLKTHMTHLRSKLGLYADGGCRMQAIPGVGYRLLLGKAAPTQHLGSA